MYERVTAEVRRRCEDGRFADPARMEHFVCSFADRYFDAHDDLAIRGVADRDRGRSAFEAAGGGGRSSSSTCCSA